MVLVQVGPPLKSSLHVKWGFFLFIKVIKKSNLELLPLDFIKTIHTKKGRLSPNRKQPEYLIEHYRLNLDGFKTNVIWCSAQNTPLQPFPIRGELGGKILKYLEDVIIDDTK